MNMTLKIHVLRTEMGFEKKSLKNPPFEAREGI